MKNKLNARSKEKYSKENLEPIVKSSKSIKEILRKLLLTPSGGNYKLTRDYISKYNLDVSHFNNPYCRPYTETTFVRKSIFDYLVENSTCSRTNLKNRLYKEGFLSPICCLCNQNENWNGMKISLILDHINGINNDNRLENLRIVCPNCNAGLDTFSGKNRKIKSGKLCECGNVMDKTSDNCLICCSIIRRKVERPPIDELIFDVENIGYSATGRKYGVSDNAIRKWIKNNRGMI